MKQSITKGITLIFFASFIGAFVWYNMQKTDEIRIEPQINKTILPLDSVKKDSIPAIVADGTEKETLKPVKKKKVAPVSEIEKKYIDLSGDSITHEEYIPVRMMGGSKSAIIEEPIRMMGGSKSIIMVEPKVDFSKTITKKKK